MLLFPTMLKNRITEITQNDLCSLGVHILMLDVDNTLTTHHSQNLPQDIAEWIRGMIRIDVTLILVSNAKKARVSPFAKKIGLPFISLACKPLPFGYWRAASFCKAEKSVCAAVGDQTFTDILGAKLAGIKAIQLRPIEPETGVGFRVRRALEKPILRAYAKRKEG